ncbi:receptor-like protein EIX2 [Cajanus cajan]|uniref:receptor-like protein EIX2 n=1 Tax=Cajanus cajan TaxID=3821 RepID=UPI0010FAD31C|nr:receptor-like protein EIX2 [Cajanus cajan]XP_029125142.1 receptor-like protein EIX2 [Cajanus cajan]
MSNYFLKMLFAMLVCIWHTKQSIHGFSSPSHVKCIEKERQALLSFKQGLRDEFGILSTWREDEDKRDCCTWKGIQCNDETGHVHMLQLPGQYHRYLTGTINITSLIHLQNIEHVDLSHNDFKWSFGDEQLMGSFTNLRYLNLSSLGFSYGRIPYEMGNLSKLEYLDLSANEIDGQVPSQLGNLSKLKYLDLWGNSFSGAIPFQVGNLPILHTLRLGGNFDLKIIDAKWLSSLSSLTTLGLEAFYDLGSSHSWKQIIRETIPNLTELKLVYCSLTDEDISFLFPSHSNLSTSLSILDLSDNMLTSSTFQLLFNYSLNLRELYLSGNDIVLLSSFYPNFPSLVILDLSGNNLTSLIFQGFFNFSSKLRELYLDSCRLTDKSFLVSSASNKNSSSSLVTLVLSHNSLKSSAIFDWIFNFTTNLHSLHLDENWLEGLIPDGFGKVMKSLEVLVLDSNKLQGEIPASLWNIFTLQELYLKKNYLSGEISNIIQNSSQCNRHVFQTLDLSYNQITGMLPNLSNFTSLRMLDLSYNQFSGEIPKSIGLLYQLEYLHLEGNHLEGDINELRLTNLSKLQVLDLTDNSLSLKFASSWVPPFQLFSLGLASCKLGPTFPSWLHTQRHLSFLDISDAGIDDFIPEWFWSKLQSILWLNMSCNSLKGTIPNLPIKLTDDYNAIILGSNQLEGEIPTFLSQAYALDLSKNKISDFNSFLCMESATTKMHTLILSNNQITGQLPNCWKHLKNSLEYLDVSNNKLSGKIPKSMGTLVHLQALVLRNNNLTGGLPFTLKNCTHLVILDVSENFLFGPIPLWIGENLPELKILSLRVNRFFRSVPENLCYLSQIHFLDLSRNNLSGGIPACLGNFTAMMEREITTSGIVKDRKITSTEIYTSIYDSNVLLTWKSQDYVFWNPDILLKSIDLSSNDLTGTIPKEIGYLFGLVSLNLSRNKLDGEIPTEIGNLSWLDFLDLSRNEFFGKIPFTLSKIDRLGVLDLSNNDLSGRIPWEGQLETFEASSFEGNLELCGKPLNKSCPGDKTTAKPQEPAVHGEEDKSVFNEALYMSLGLGFFAGFWGLLGPIILWKPWRIAYLRFLNRVTDSILVRVELNIAKCCR